MSLVGFAGIVATSCRVSTLIRTAICSSLRQGIRKDQETITDQITRTIEDHLGIYMTAASISSHSRGVLSRGQSGRHGDAQSASGTRLEQDHANLCRLV